MLYIRLFHGRTGLAGKMAIVTVCMSMKICFFTMVLTMATGVFLQMKL